MAVTVTLDLPPHVEERLRAEGRDLSATMREAFALHLFRQDLIGPYELEQILGIDRQDAHDLLNRHDVPNPPLTHERVDEDVENLKRYFRMRGKFVA